jgi:hypothetical protein
MEKENATTLYVGVIKLYTTFHKLAVEIKFEAQMNTARVHLKDSNETAKLQCGADKFTIS